METLAEVGGVGGDGGVDAGGRVGGVVVDCSGEEEETCAVVG